MQLQWKKCTDNLLVQINTTKNRFSVKDNKDVYNMIFTPWFVYVSKTSFKYTNNEKNIFLYCILLRYASRRAIIHWTEMLSLRLDV